MSAAWRGSGLRRRLASHLALPLRRGDGNGAVVVVVAAGLLADEVLDLAAVLRLPVERWRLQRHAAVRHHVLRPRIPTSFYYFMQFISLNRCKEMSIHYFQMIEGYF